MANEIDTHVSCNTLERTPFDWHVVFDVASVGENGIVAREAPTFEFLWRVVVDTERPLLVTPSAGVRRRFTFV